MDPTPGIFRLGLHWDPMAFYSKILVWENLARPSAGFLAILWSLFSNRPPQPTKFQNLDIRHQTSQAAVDTCNTSRTDVSVIQRANQASEWDENRWEQERTGDAYIVLYFYWESILVSFCIHSGRVDSGPFWLDQVEEFRGPRVGSDLTGPLHIFGNHQILVPLGRVGSILTGRFSIYKSPLSMMRMRFGCH